MMLLAWFAIQPERIAQFLMTLLMIAGAGLAGLVLFTFLTWAIDRATTGGRAPMGLHRAIRYTGAVGCAVLAAIILFGNFGTGDGTGDGSGGTSPTNPGGPGANANSTAGATVATTITPPTAPTELKPQEFLVRVEVLSGAYVKEPRFYRLQQEAVLKNLNEVKEWIQRQRPPGPRPVLLEIRLGERTDRNNSGVLDLESWGLSEGFRVLLPGSGN